MKISLKVLYLYEGEGRERKGREAGEYRAACINDKGLTSRKCKEPQISAKRHCNLSYPLEWLLSKNNFVEDLKKTASKLKWNKKIYFTHTHTQTHK